jgi:hypothetical protein
MNNTFSVEILPDGKLKITAPGGFSPETHQDADEFVAMMKDLMGGECETKKMQPHLGNPHTQQQGQGQHHSH